MAVLGTLHEKSSGVVERDLLRSSKSFLWLSVVSTSPGGCRKWCLPVRRKVEVAEVHGLSGRERQRKGLSGVGDDWVLGVGSLGCDGCVCTDVYRNSGSGVKVYA